MKYIRCRLGLSPSWEWIQQNSDLWPITTVELSCISWFLAPSWYQVPACITEDLWGGIAACCTTTPTLSHYTGYCSITHSYHCCPTRGSCKHAYTLYRPVHLLSRTKNAWPASSVEVCVQCKKTATNKTKTKGAMEMFSYPNRVTVTASVWTVK